MTRRVAILGSTGSIGTQALDVVAGSGEAFTVRSLAANTDWKALAGQVDRFRPDLVAMADAGAAARLREARPGLEVLEGGQAIVDLAADADADVVLNAVVGAAGLRATLAALDAGRFVALANKESCVAGGPLVAQRLAEGRGSLVPVDSEHASVHMCLRGEDPASVRRVVLTASGGPFRGRGRADLEGVGIDDALAHPTWSMGAKITVDSATLMNKGLEVIEAHVLFGVDYDDIEVVCHPQSVLHCIVEFADGSWKSALGPPDMRVPIAYALGHPSRPAWAFEPTDWARMQDLSFEAVDTSTFECLPLAYEVGRAGGMLPAVLNAANEAAVGAFLDGRAGFLEIARIVREVTEAGDEFARTPDGIDDVLEADRWARRHAERLIG